MKTKYIVLLSIFIIIIYLIFDPVLLIIIGPIMFFLLLGYINQKAFTVNILTFKKRKDYYRDIIDNYSPEVLLYINYLKVDLDIAIIVSLLFLQLKGCIKIDNNNIYKIKEPTTLPLSSKYIYDSINNNLVMIDNEKMIGLVEEQAINMELVSPTSKSHFNSRIRIFLETFIRILIIVLFLIIIISLLFPQATNIIFFYIIVFAFFGGCIIEYSLFAFSFGEKKAKEDYALKRSTEGENIYKKLLGLNNFIKDFGNLSEKQATELIMWEDYLIYSVIFNQNTSIINKYKIYIKH